MTKRRLLNDRLPYLIIKNEADIDQYTDRLRTAAAHLTAWIARHDGDALDLVHRMKFDLVGLHPIGHYCLNVVEQINQTLTYVVAFAATKELLRLHPDAGGFRVAPGAHMALPLDIMSERENLVGAETFAAVHPRNNGKLAHDLAKMAGRPETHRYVFFGSPAFPCLKHLNNFDREGVQVWSVDI